MFPATSATSASTALASSFDNSSASPNCAAHWQRNLAGLRSVKMAHINNVAISANLPTAHSGASNPITDSKDINCQLRCQSHTRVVHISQCEKRDQMGLFTLAVDGDECQHINHFESRHHSVGLLALQEHLCLIGEHRTQAELASQVSCQWNQPSALLSLSLELPSAAEVGGSGSAVPAAAEAAIKARASATRAPPALLAELRRRVVLSSEEPGRSVPGIPAKGGCGGCKEPSAVSSSETLSLMGKLVQSSEDRQDLAAPQGTIDAVSTRRDTTT